MRILRAAGAVLGAVLVSATPAAANDSGPAHADTLRLAPDRAARAEQRRAIDAAAGALLASHPEVPALCVGVWDPDRGTTMAAYGVADPATGRPATIADGLRIDALGSTLTVAVALDLAGQGRLALEEPVSLVAARFAADHPELADRTVAAVVAQLASEDADGIPALQAILEEATSTPLPPLVTTHLHRTVGHARDLAPDGR